MIRDLAGILGPERRSALRAYLVWVTVYGIAQGAAMVPLVPLLRRLLGGEVAGALPWLGVMAALTVIACGAHYLQSMTGFAVAVAVLTTTHQRVGDHVAQLPLGWFNGEQVGRLSRVLTAGTMSVAGLFAHLLTPLVVGVVTPATIGLALVFFDWRLALAVLVSAPLVYLAFRWSATLIGRGEELTTEATVAAANRVVEFAQCQPVLRAFGRTVDGHPPLEEAIARQHATSRRALWLTVPGFLATGFAVQLVFSALIAVGVVLALGGTVGAAELIAVLALAARFTGPLAEAAELSGASRTARNDVRRIADVLAEAPLREPARSAELSTFGQVELRRVTFGYTPSEPVLSEVTFTVPPRTMTALVGASGSGKTTVTRLIARFWDVDTGTISVGGADVRHQPTDQLMDQLALVFQDVYLFDDTLEANIRLGRSAATDDEVREAARLAGLDEVVARLPDGWHTQVGEGGMALSGGERQRVAIARAILKDAPVVLLDEATAALDPENERYVQNAMRVLMERSTLLVIAHRLSTVVAADQIVVLDAGSVVERGTHTELLGIDGAYAAFWRQRQRARGWRLTTR